jgi:hypothetical protein
MQTILIDTSQHFAPIPPAYDPLYHCQLAIDTGLNAYASLLGFLETGAAMVAGQVPLILKLNSHDLLCRGQDSRGTQRASVRDALRLGCVAVGYTIYPGTTERRLQYEQLRGLTVWVIHTDEEWMIAKTVAASSTLSQSAKKGIPTMRRDTGLGWIRFRNAPPKVKPPRRRNMNIGTHVDRGETDLSNALSAGRQQLIKTKLIK